MNNNNFIYDREGHIIGRMDGDWIRSADGRLVARYDESDNRTRDNTGKIIGSSDLRLLELGKRLTNKK